MTEVEKINKVGWNFENSYVHLPKSFYSIINPSHVNLPKLVIFNDALAESLGLNAKALQTEDGVSVLAGNMIPEGAEPIAQAYAGHQFGHFTMLGDGRALLIGEHVTPSGDRYDIQLKGSGKTPYSRGGDGKASLGPMLREYIISEAMHALGIPTTRSLAVVTTGENVIREKLLPGAILTRVASSHIRVGTFEYVSSWCTVEDLKILADYTINRHFPYIQDNENKYLSLLKEVIKKQSELIAKWQMVGFIHGVMNTDNMVISGETIDYGPCAFMDAYDETTVFSSIDTRGRYAYGNQPHIAGWNLARLAETLLPLLNANQDKAIALAQDAISGYSELYYYNWIKGMRAKLGIFNEELQDESIIKDLLSIMQKYKVDYTNTFYSLTTNTFSDSVMFGSSEFIQWHKLWKERLERQQESIDDSVQLMRNTNPAVIPRNHKVEEALDAAVNQNDYSVLKKLLDVLQSPYEYSSRLEEYSTPPPVSTCPYITFCGT